jgi:hypothetical protein
MKKIITLAFLALFVGSACSEKDQSGWFLDASFSVQLITFWGAPLIVSQQDPASTVNVLQIFRVPQRKSRLFTVDEIRSQELMYETNNSPDIVAFFRATRHRIKEHCGSAQGRFVFFILAFDRDLMRVGLLKYYPCTEEEDMGWFQTWGSNSAYTSRDFAKMMNRLIPFSIQRGK